MFSHYLSTALRHLVRHKTTTAINVLCLALGLTCFAVAYGMVKYSRSGDLFHEKAQRTFVITQRSEFIDAQNSIGTVPLVGMGFAAHLKADYPAIEVVARATRGKEHAVSTQGAKNFAEVSYADPEFLDVFDLNFVAGDRRAALRTPHSAVISTELAQRLFGRTDVLGAAIRLNNRETVHITGVMGVPRQPSHITFHAPQPALQFSLLASMDTLESIERTRGAAAPNVGKRFFKEWAFTYVVFPHDGSIKPEQLHDDLGRFAARHVPPEAGHAILGLRPAANINELFMDFTVRSDETGVSGSAVLLLLGSLVLGVSVVNYANLASAQATTRLKEIALRRVTGATYRQVVMQALIEALVLVIAAAFLALMILPAVLKGMRAQVGLDLSSVLMMSPTFWVGMLMTMITVATLACSYPAFFAARIRPSYALHSGRLPLTKRRTMRLLVVLQFFAASFLLIVTDVISTQNKSVGAAQSGTGADPIVAIFNNLQDAGIDRELLHGELRRQVGVTAVSAIDVAPGTAMGTVSMVLKSAEPESQHWTQSAPTVDYGFLALAKIPLLVGRDFDRNAGDELVAMPAKANVIIDREMAMKYGWVNPQDAIGKPIYVASSSAKGAVGLPRTVIGVVENHALYQLKRGSSATFYTLDPPHAGVSLVRISRANIAGGLAAIDRVWNGLAPDVPLKRRFLDEYAEDTRRKLNTATPIWSFVAMFSLLIAAMGLVGIATHAINQRTFEIGVRKSLGASVRQVLTMLLVDFSRPVIIAALLSWPFAFVVAKGLGSLYSHPAPLTIAPFVVSLAIGLAIAWLAVIRQAVRAATLQPAQVLRHE